MTNRLPPDRGRLRDRLADRLARVRHERYGEHGGAELARLLGLTPGTWAGYERGVAIPGEVLLAFIEATGVEPAWLLRGIGPAYRDG